MADLHALKEEIEALSPADRLRLAASLLEADRPKLAHTIAERVALELGAKLLLSDPPTTTRSGR